MKRKDHDPGLVIDYTKLDTISIDEFAQALWTDIQALKENYDVKFVTAPKLTIPVTNEYGDPLTVRYQRHRTVRHIDTHHYEPACKDFKL